MCLGHADDEKLTKCLEKNQPSKVPSKRKKGPEKKIQRSEEVKCHQRSRGGPPCCWSFTPSENLLPSLEDPPLPTVPPRCRGHGAAPPGAEGVEEGRVKVIPAIVVSLTGTLVPGKSGGAQGPAPILNPALAWHKAEGNPSTSAWCMTLNKLLPFLLKWGV